MKQHVMLYEQFKNKHNLDLYEQDGDIFNMNALLLEEVSKNIIDKIKRGKSIWIKHKDWENWGEYRIHSIITYNSGDITLKLINTDSGKIWSFSGKDFKDYDASLDNPWLEPKMRAKRGKMPIAQKELKQILRSYQLKKHTESEAIDMLQDLIKQRPEIQEYVMTRFGIERDYVLDFLYSFV